MIEKATKNKWIATLFALMLGSYFGMAYVNKGRRALIYLCIELAIIFLLSVPDIFDIQTQFFTTIPQIYLELSFSAFLFIFRVYAAIQCFKIAKNKTYPAPDKFYARPIFIASMCIFLFIFPFIFKTYFYQRYSIPSKSMLPNLVVGTKIWSKKHFFKPKQFQRGDVVTFKREGAIFLKRIIGLPGEDIEVKNGIVYINNSPIERKAYNSSPALDPQQNPSNANVYKEILSNGRSYLILDNGITSIDEFGNINIQDNHYFMMGDNRDYSYDSRSYGTVPFEDIQGIILVE